jgi:predicted DNA-binding protein
MEVDMALVKKTTILFPPELHARLASLAAQRGVSLGHLVRSACEAHFGLASVEERLEAVDELFALELPVGEVEQLKRESVPTPDKLLP